MLTCSMVEMTEMLLEPLHLLPLVYQLRHMKEELLRLLVVLAKVEHALGALALIDLPFVILRQLLPVAILMLRHLLIFALVVVGIPGLDLDAARLVRNYRVRLQLHGRRALLRLILYLRLCFVILR